MEQAAVQQPGPATCDVDGCSEPASFSYQFDYGSNGSGGAGVVCAGHSTLKHQQARNIKRQVYLTALSDAPKPAISRDERTRLNAEIITLKQELADVQARGRELYQRNVSLTAEVQRLTVLHRESTARATDAAADLKLAQDAAEQYQLELGQVTDELQRTKVLLDASHVDAPSSSE